MQWKNILKLFISFCSKENRQKFILARLLAPNLTVHCRWVRKNINAIVEANYRIKNKEPNWNLLAG